MLKYIFNLENWQEVPVDRYLTTRYSIPSGTFRAARAISRPVAIKSSSMMAKAIVVRFANLSQGIIY